jgi:hypothetical protein
LWLPQTDEGFQALKASPSRGEWDKEDKLADKIIRMLKQRGIKPYVK